MKITYLSHGLFPTGGYFHEKTLCEAISGIANNCDICFTEVRFRRNFKGPFAWLLLLLKSMFHANGDVVVTVARLGMPVWWRIRFGRAKMLLVLHNLDQSDGKRKLYHRQVKRTLKLAARHPNRIAVVVVAEYWKQQVQEMAKGAKVFLFPNLFDNAKLHFYRDVVSKKSNLIHLGQYSSKIDRKAYHLLISSLKQAGLVCYFSDNTGQQSQDFPISHFSTHEAYLKQMALSSCTIILNAVQEGWNRVAHESFLVGTQVISKGGGGLSELVQTGNGYLVKDVEDACWTAQQPELRPISYGNLVQFDLSNRDTFATPICAWLKQ